MHNVYGMKGFYYLPKRQEDNSYYKAYKYKLGLYKE